MGSFLKLDKSIPVAIIVIIGFLAFLSAENAKQKELIYGLQQRLGEFDYERKFKDNLKEEIEARKKEQEFLLQRDYEKQLEERINNRLEEFIQLERQDVAQVKEMLDAANNENARQLREYAVALDEFKAQLKYLSERYAEDIKKLEDRLSESDQLLSRRADEVELLRQELGKQNFSLGEAVNNYNELLSQVSGLKSELESLRNSLSVQPEPAKGQ